MRVKSKNYGSNFEIELDFKDKRITKFDTKNKNLNSMKLPKSFEFFVKEISNGLIIDIGNSLEIFPIEKSKYFWTSINQITNEFINDAIIPNDDFIIFGMNNGVDSEFWAFYTDKKFKNGEYPIVWINPGALGNDYFALANSRFDRFLTIQYYLLKSTDYEESMTYQEALKKSKDDYFVEKEEKKYQELLDTLYNIFEPIIPTPQGDFDENAMTIEQLNKLIDKVNDKIN